MSWALLLGVALVLGLSLFVSLARRTDLARMRGAVRERERAARDGANRTQLQHPVVDLSRCLGCATCVAVCPEDGVLEIVHGQAIVVNGSRCQGISACERECPVGAITVTLSNLEERRDIPVLSEDLEAPGTPGLFLAGEVTAHSLIRTAVAHGTRVAAEVGRRGAAAEDLDLCIVGAGPAGLACALEATRLGLSFVLLEQEAVVGGTVATYPRRKLVLTEPIDLPLVGRLRERTYEKEELIELWRRAAEEHALPIETDAVLEGVTRRADASFAVQSSRGTWQARHVCLALGRRGVPARLGVPGEELPKVAHALIDAASFRGRRILVVGGGDSAVETALALAEQPDNQVSLAYRKATFFRIRSRNEAGLDRARRDGRVEVLLRSEVRAIRADAVDLTVDDERGGTRRLALPNDEVFVMVGGTPPFELLDRAGVSFDPSERPAARQVGERGTGAAAALAIGLALTLLALAWAGWNSDYYGLPLAERPTHDKHALLRPSLGVGLGLGIASVALIVVNLLYLLRRSTRAPLQFGSLRAWMTSHVATGVLAFLCAVLHASMAPRDTPGGNAFWALFALLITGAIGRYFYAWVPRAANGRELRLSEVKARVAGLGGSAGSSGFSGRARAEVGALADARQWKGTFFGRALALCGLQLDLRRTLRRLTQEGRTQGVDAAELRRARALAREAHGAALAAAHLEDLRAVLSTWRYLHRWVALLMVALVLVHVVYALAYGAFFFERGRA